MAARSGSRWSRSCPATPSSPTGRRPVQAVYQLFEGTTGRPLAVIDGTALTLRKTAANSGLGAKLLARADARTLLMIGAGALAPHLIGAHRAVRPSLERVLVWNRSAPRRDRLLAELAARGIPAEPAHDLAAAVRTADVVSAATLARSPWCAAPGSSPGPTSTWSAPTRRRCARPTTRPCAARASTSTTRGSTVEESGDLIQPLASGAITRQDVLGDLFDLCQGRAPGRRSADEITLFKNGGGSHLDLFSAEFLLRRLDRKRPPEPDDAVPPPVRAAGAAPPSRRSTRRWLSSSAGPLAGRLARAILSSAERAAWRRLRRRHAAVRR